MQYGHTSFWFSQDLFFGRHDIAEILLKVALNRINQFKSKPNLLGCRGQPRHRSVSTLVIYISDHKTLYFTVVIMYYN